MRSSWTKGRALAIAAVATCFAASGEVQAQQGQAGTTGSWQGSRSGFRAWIGPCKGTAPNQTRTVQILSGWIQTTTPSQRKQIIASSTATPPIGEASAEVPCGFKTFKAKAFTVTLQCFSPTTGIPTTTTSGTIVVVFDELTSAGTTIKLASSTAYEDGFVEVLEPVGRTDETPGG